MQAWAFCQPLLCYQGWELRNPHHRRRVPFAGQRFGLLSSAWSAGSIVRKKAKRSE